MLKQQNSLNDLNITRMSGGFDTTLPKHAHFAESDQAIQAYCSNYVPPKKTRNSKTRSTKTIKLKKLTRQEYYSNL